MNLVLYGLQTETEWRWRGWRPRVSIVERLLTTTRICGLKHDLGYT
jgi:hypothetical protein